MGKQTKQKGSHFGGEWTIQKLHIIEEYLKTYAQVLKNTKVKKIYVDGFAGSGITELKTKTEEVGDLLVGLEEQEKTPTIVEGSALLSLKYNFDEYYFLELDSNRIEVLKENIKKNYPDKISKVKFIKGDSNTTLLEVVGKITKYDRCLMFLDPYALELKWETLEAISKCSGVDLWYLFPLSLVRLIEKERNITESNKQKIIAILGTDEWYNKLFEESEQVDMFGEKHYSRVEFEEVLKYVKSRFLTIFSYVSPDSKVLKNEAKNSPMFMLCFMMTNTSKPAQNLASKLVKGIIKSTEKV